MADPQRYERNLASLLVGKVCRPDATASIVHGLVKRIMDDIRMTGEQRAHHQNVAHTPLSQLGETIDGVAEGDCRPRILPLSDWMPVPAGR